MAPGGGERYAGLLRPQIERLREYQAVDPPEVLEARAAVPPERMARLNGNENPYGASPRLAEALAGSAVHHLYPDPLQRRARGALAEYVGLGPEHIVAGAGADELIDLVLRAVLGPGEEVVTCEPTFGMYRFAGEVAGGGVVDVDRDDRFDVDAEACARALRRGAKVAFICSPNNPTGNLCPRPVVERLLDEERLVVVDETYYEFSGWTVAPLVGERRNLVVLRSLSKWAGLAGIRVGYAVAPEWLVEALLRSKPPYNLSSAAEAALLTSLEDRALLMERVRAIVRERDRMARALEAVPGIQVWPSEGNFLLCQAPAGEGRRVVSGLAERGVFVRYFAQPRLGDCFRATVGLRQHTDALAGALQTVLYRGC